jgi:hypothetical protein
MQTGFPIGAGNDRQKIRETRDALKAKKYEGVNA